MGLDCIDHCVALDYCICKCLKLIAQGIQTLMSGARSTTTRRNASTTDSEGDACGCSVDSR
ncbi:hypothetical protein O9929_05865 [Vibrio lentus]|nr:hypothetical protein [Vibrio lentus]